MTTPATRAAAGVAGAAGATAVVTDAVEVGRVADGAWRIVAGARESSVPRVRHAVRDLLRARGLAGERYEDLTDGLLLIVSELVTNAVTHAAVLSPRVTTELVIGGGWVRVAVEDGHPYCPKAVQSDADQTGGRGLMLVKSIALAAGGACDVEQTGDGGKVIWAALPLPLPQPGPLPHPGPLLQPGPVPQPGPLPRTPARSLPAERAEPAAAAPATRPVRRSPGSPAAPPRTRW
ncbi:ATP-binding protein [Kitasatospora sp. LaBMicrA B282]|uniref:ATP-binding protein n=1 Tax=Kitasatospora sp. LaBMicrA B282 TaxID=3420949 RepID=UPI003D098026